jgi:hypothetical protein
MRDPAGLARVLAAAFDVAPLFEGGGILQPTYRDPIVDDGFQAAVRSEAAKLPALRDGVRILPAALVPALNGWEDEARVPGRARLR